MKRYLSLLAVLTTLLFTVSAQDIKTDYYFSVSATQHVVFAPGNLQYRASTNTWRFAPHQYDCVGQSGNTNISADNDDWIDLFGWGTSGYNGKHPYLNPLDETDYVMLPNISGTNYDWGRYNTIGNYPAGTWRLLTADEWTYLLRKRPNAESLIIKAVVRNINGVILLPDNWVNPTETSFLTGNKKSFDSNEISVGDWLRMESAGAVFLPAAGARSNISYDFFQKYGCYWTGTMTDEENKVNFVAVSNGIVDLGSFKRSQGMSVRLAHEIHTTAATTQATNGEAQKLQAAPLYDNDYDPNVVGSSAKTKAAEKAKATVKSSSTRQVHPFSVSETRKVLFAPGNLQYQASTNTWRFAPHQYESTKENNGKTSATSTTWIDLFGWGTSGYNNKMPYIINSDNTYFGNGTQNISRTNYDWGQYVKIGNYPAGTWRTPTQSEWEYVLTKRNRANLLCGAATIDGKQGYILLPDDWSYDIHFNAGKNAKYTANTYTITEWEQMEQHGAVFFPATG